MVQTFSIVIPVSAGVLRGPNRGKIGTTQGQEILRITLRFLKSVKLVLWADSSWHTVRASSNKFLASHFVAQDLWPNALPLRWLRWVCCLEGNKTISKG